MYKIAKQKPGNVISIIVDGTEIGVGSISSKLMAPIASSEEWNFLGNAAEVSSNPEIESESRSYFDSDTKLWVTDDEPSIKNWTKSFTLNEYSDPVWQLVFGLNSPLVVGGKQVPYLGRPFIMGWTKIEKYTERSELISTEIIYGRLALDGGITENNKLVSPKLKLTIINTPVATLDATSLIAQTKSTA